LRYEKKLCADISIPAKHIKDLLPGVKNVAEN